MRTAASPRRQVTRVAVGVLFYGDGRVLLADRPSGKPYAGYWEFPGGKIEPGEDVAAALERELHEELGIDVGPSDPWVTFEFDYPHAYVELQFRVVRDWRGVPHAREGQQLLFVDPAGELPQPLLPAAVPALRWLRLPRTAYVVGSQELSELLAAESGSLGVGRSDTRLMIVVDVEGRAALPKATLALLRANPATRGCLLLASVAGVPLIEDVDGVVLEASALATAGERASGWRGAWVSSRDQSQLAAKSGCDFALVESSALAEQLCAQSASLPAYFPSGRTSIEATEPARWPGQGRWVDLRRPA